MHSHQAVEFIASLIAIFAVSCLSFHVSPPPTPIPTHRRGCHNRQVVHVLREEMDIWCTHIWHTARQ